MTTRNRISVEEAERRARTIIRREIPKLLRSLQRQCPVETGRARSSIRVQLQSRPSAGSYRVVMHIARSRRLSITAFGAVDYFKYLVNNKNVTNQTKNGRTIRSQWFREICRSWFTALRRQIEPLFREAGIVWNPEFVPHRR